MSPSHARKLDQFYTDSLLASQLTHRLVGYLRESQASLASPVLFLEPSAGEGVFLEALWKEDATLAAYGCDLDPKHPCVVRGNFFQWVQPAPGSWVVFGNPPFGKNATLAVQFFNHAATFAEVIAFIVPRTFEKKSLKNRLSPAFDLVDEVAIAPLSFHFEGERVAVPCVFQIWHRLPSSQTRSRLPTLSSHRDFTFQKHPAGAAFAFQRVGAAAGRTKPLDAPHVAPPSHYFMVPREGLSGEELRRRLDAIDWQPIKERTAGNPSISKSELIEAYTGRWPASD